MQNGRNEALNLAAASLRLPAAVLHRLQRAGAIDVQPIAGGWCLIANDQAAQAKITDASLATLPGGIL